MIAPKHSVHLLTKRLYILGLHSALLLFQVINHGDHASLWEKPFSTLQPYPTITHTHQHGYCCSRATAFLPSHVLPRFASLLSRQLGFAPEAGKSDRHGVPLPPRAGGWARADGAAQSPPPSGGHAAPHSQTHVCSSLQPYFLSSHRSPLALTARDPPTGRARRHGLLPSWLGVGPRYCFLSINSLRPPPSGLPPPQKSYRSTSAIQPCHPYIPSARGAAGRR